MAAGSRERRPFIEFMAQPGNGFFVETWLCHGRLEAEGEYALLQKRNFG